MKNKKTVVKVVSIIIVLAIIVGVAIGVTNNQNVMLADNEKMEEQEETQELVLEDNEYMHVETDASGDSVPVPNGFVGSSVTGENEIDTGFVIYEGEEEVTDSNVQTAQTSRNQYVWVPVPDPSKFYGTDANGKRWGKLYDFDMDNNNETGTEPLDWSESNGVMRITNSSGRREPDVVTDGGEDYDIDSNLRTLGLGAETTHEFLMQLEKEFNKMINSVEKYGGFYIGRYETGNLNQDVAVVQKGNDDIGSQTWYAMYEKCKTLSDNNNNIATGMIWGNQWDRIIMWLIECNTKNPETGKSKEEVISDSSSWGNYYNVTFTYTNSSGSTATKNQNFVLRIPTGSTEYTKANNIYDLAGNVHDLTMEANSSSRRVDRGGYYNNYGYDVPASDRRSSYHPDQQRRLPWMQGCTVRQVKIASVTCDTSNEIVKITVVRLCRLHSVGGGNPS